MVQTEAELKQYNVLSCPILFIMEEHLSSICPHSLFSDSLRYKGRLETK